MDKNVIRKEIAVLIDSIKEHSDNIGNKEQIPQLELEVILKKIEKLYEKSIVFNFLSKLNESEPEKSAVTEKVSSPSIDSQVLQTSSSKEKPEPQAVMDLFGSELPPAPKVVKENTKKAAPSAAAPKSAITDLKAAIGINEKFQFINELFDGNMQEYNLAINQLDNFTSLNEAQVYINSLREIYRWKENTPVTEHFIGLMERRYPNS